MLYREIIAVCSQFHTKHINTLCGQNGELVNVNLAVRIVATGSWWVNLAPRHECVRRNWQTGPRINPCSRCRHSALRPGRFNLGTHWIWGWVGTTAGSDVSEQRQIFCPFGKRPTRPTSVTVPNCEAVMPHTGYGRRSVFERKSNFRLLK